MAVCTISPAGGNWSAAGAWDGGVPPTSADDVVCRADGTSGNLTNDVTNQACRSMDFTNGSGYSATWAINVANLNVGTSTAGPGNVLIKLSTTMSLSASSANNAVTVVTTQAHQTLTCAGRTLPWRVIVNSAGGGLDLADDFRSSTSTAQGLSFSNGGFKSNGHGITATVIGATANANTRAIDLTGSLVAIGLAAGTGTPWVFSGAITNLTLTTTGSTIQVTANSNTQTFAGGGFTYAALSLVMASAVTITGANTFTSITALASASKTLTLPASATTTATSVSLAGTDATKILSIVSSSAGTAATLSVASGTVTANFVNIKDNTGTGGASFQATHATINTNVTGWTLVGTGTVDAAVGALTSTGAKLGSGTGTTTASSATSSVGHVYGIGSGTVTAVTGLSSTGTKSASGTGTVSAVSALSMTGLSLPPEDLTLAWWFTPDVAATGAVGGQLTVRGTIGGVVRNAIVLGYASQRFTLTAGGVTVQSPVQDFAAGTHVFLALRLSAAGLALSVKAGSEAIQHVRDATARNAGVEELVDLYLGTSVSTWGSGTWGSGVWGGLSLPSGVIDNLMGFSDALSDTEVAALATAVSRLAGLPTPEGRLVWYVPFDPRPVPLASPLASGRRYEATASGGSSRFPGLTKALAALDAAVVRADGLTLAAAQGSDLAAYLATTDDEDDLADHHAQLAAENSQEVRVR